MTYVRFVAGLLNDVEPGVPIYTADLASRLAEAFGMERSKANAAAGVAMKRILDGNRCPRLRFYKKGIYYLAVPTPFGETGIDKERLIRDKYLAHGSGYETGHAALYRLGLTSQLPAERVIATNRARECLRPDKSLGVSVRPPKTTVTEENRHYLQILDVLELMGKAPVDVEDPYALLSDYVAERALSYDRLLAIADRYYSRNTVIEIAHVANAGCAL